MPQQSQNSDHKSRSANPKKNHVLQDMAFLSNAENLCRDILLSSTPKSARHSRGPARSPLMVARELRAMSEDDLEHHHRQPPPLSGDVALGLLLPRGALTYRGGAESRNRDSLGSRTTRRADKVSSRLSGGGSIADSLTRLSKSSGARLASRISH